jgi:putative two-component system hydrogenase maturation factor HypX/HoxX
MRILLISSAFSGLTQRFYTELDDAGYIVSVELHLGDIEQLLEGVALFKPDLIICPFLTKRVPPEIYENYTCLIVHPGIKGDRGPSSLDWAIQTGEQEWGVSLLEAREEMDSGDIWANKTFAVRTTTKSSLFYREVTQAAVDCLWEALTYFHAPDFRPQPLDYGHPDFKGRLQPLMKQADRALDWKKHKTDEILRRINAADGSPGVLDEINGKPCYLYNAHKESQLTGKAGEIIATANHAICRATVDGAVWIGHLKPRLDNGKGIKLPATFVLKDLPANNTSTFKKLLSKGIQRIDIDYTQAGQQLPCQEVWYELEGKIAYLYFPFHNGGMSTEQCRLLLSVYQHICTLAVDVIVLMGGEDNWSNGIHLNHIEAADSPADESWLNINAIDDIVYQIITTLDKITISAVAGNAGAGGAILALAADQVFAREGVIFNPHYKNMGELYGSEYWTYLLPKRVGQEMASNLTEQRLPISAKKAWRIGLIDKMLDKQHNIFHAQIRHLAQAYTNDVESLKNLLTQKATTRCLDETMKPLVSYRQFELTHMYANFYGNDDYHQARRNFVYKTSTDKQTPENIAIHRQTQKVINKLSVGSLSHFVWQELYNLGDEEMDEQHKDLFLLADQLVNSNSKDELNHNIQLLYTHVKEHFAAEEALMKKSEFQGYKGHEKEHQFMLEKLTAIDHKINNDNWQQTDIEEFVDKWAKHIINADMKFEDYLKKAAVCVE